MSDTERMTGELLAPDIEMMLEQRDTHAVRAALLGLMDPELAEVIIALSPKYRVLAFRLLPKDRAADVFTFLPPEHQEELLAELSGEQLSQIFNEMDPDDRAELFEEMPGQLAAKILALMRPEERRQTQIILGYPAESVGRIMTPDYLTLEGEWTCAQALDFIRHKGSDAEILQTMYVVDERGKLLNEIRLRDIVVAEPQRTIASLIDGHVVALQASDDREEAVRAMDRYDRPVLPVIDSSGILVGIVTFDDVADVAQEEITEDIQKMGGIEALDEPYMSTSLTGLVRKRGTWLSALFLGEMLTASAMTHYQGEIERAVVLSLFLPLIISSGGNSGSQASTLIIRAMALREIGLRDWFRVLRRELACGLLLGVMLGALGFVRIHLWQYLGWANYGEYHTTASVAGVAHISFHLIALTVGVALIGVVLWGTLMGSMLPFLIRMARLDPATISAPLVATLVDVTGLIIYFNTGLLILRSILK